jgi:UDP-3-O-[3-hydroxymyristoyl] glucosamine N-acyltransferase
MSESGPTSYSLREIAARLGGEVVGDPELRVSRVASLENATEDAISFLADERYLARLAHTRAKAVIVGEKQRESTRLPRIVCSNPYAYFARVSALFHPEPAPVPGTHATALVAPSAVLGAGVEIGPYAIVGERSRIGPGAVIGAACYIGEGVSIGRQTRLHPHVTVYRDCVIGERVVLHSGVVIGADGFGIAFDAGRWVKVPQIGRVVIGDDVEIGANTTVDRGALDDTVIEEGAKLDNLIQVGHNVRIGAHTAIAACVGIAGSARIGRYCRIGGASGIYGHVTIADHVEISAYTLVMKSIDKPGTYTGAYAFEPHERWRRNAAQLRHLHELARRVRALEQRLARVEENEP